MSDEARKSASPAPAAATDNAGAASPPSKKMDELAVKPDETPATGSDAIGEGAGANKAEDKKEGDATTSDAKNDAPAAETNGGDDDAAVATDAAAAAAPISAVKKKATPKGVKRKSIGGESAKGKTPKKAEQLKVYERGEAVLAKMKSYPPWPSIILDEDTMGVLKDRKPKAKDPLIPTEFNTHYPVMFMGTYEVSWMMARDIDPLDDDIIKRGPTTSKKSKNLVQAYQQAEKGFTLDDVKAYQSVDHMEVEPSAEDFEDIEEDIPSEEEKPKKKGSKRRKKSAEDSDDETSPKPTKTPKRAPKTPKSSTTKKVSTKKAPSTKRKNKSEAVVHSEDEADVQPESEEKAPGITDVESLDDEQQHRFLMHRRHVYQKAFLNKDSQLPTRTMMPEHSRHLEDLEQWESISAALIRTTKIHKVLKGILKISPDAIPREEEFDFRSRCQKLFDKWSAKLAADDAKITDSAKKENGTASSPVTEQKPNGEAADTKDGDAEMKDVAAAEKKEDGEDQKEGTAAALPEANGVPEEKKVEDDKTEEKAAEPEPVAA